MLQFYSAIRKVHFFIATCSHCSCSTIIIWHGKRRQMIPPRAGRRGIFPCVRVQQRRCRGDLLLPRARWKGRQRQGCVCVWWSGPDRTGAQPAATAPASRSPLSLFCRHALSRLGGRARADHLSTLGYYYLSTSCIFICIATSSSVVTCHSKTNLVKYLGSQV